MSSYFLHKAGMFSKHTMHVLSGVCMTLLYVQVYVYVVGIGICKTILV